MIIRFVFSVVICFSYNVLHDPLCLLCQNNNEGKSAFDDFRFIPLNDGTVDSTVFDNHFIVHHEILSNFGYNAYKFPL